MSNQPILQVNHLSKNFDANRYDAPQAAVWIYAVVFFLYFLACWPISLAAGRLEKKWA